MSKKCIICGRSIGNYGIYCPKCQEDLERKLKKREKFEEVYRSADFFERMNLKETKDALKARQNRYAKKPASKK